MNLWHYCWCVFVGVIGYFMIMMNIRVEHCIGCCCLPSLSVRINESLKFLSMSL